MNKKKYKCLVSALGLILLVACGGGETTYTPKPKAYFAMQLPERTGYQMFESADCPYKFAYPNYARVDIDSTFFNEAVTDPCWLDIVLPNMSAKIHLSYKELNEKNLLENLVADAYELTEKHTIKASSIDYPRIKTPKGVSGVKFLVGGDAASNMQFYLTDSTNHFVRGALYFGMSPNEDSLRPVINYVRQDLDYMINSLEWKE